MYNGVVFSGLQIIFDASNTRSIKQKFDKSNRKALHLYTGLAFNIYLLIFQT